MILVLQRPRPMAELAMAERERRRESGQKAQAHHQAHHKSDPCVCVGAYGPRGPCREIKRLTQAG